MTYTIKGRNGKTLVVLGDRREFDVVAEALDFAKRKVAPAPDDDLYDHMYDSYEYFTIRESNGKFVYERAYQRLLVDLPEAYYPAEDYPVFYYEVYNYLGEWNLDLKYVDLDEFVGTRWDSEVDGRGICEDEVEMLLEAFDYNSQNFDSIDCCLEFMRKYREYRRFYASLQHEEIEEDGEKFDEYWLTVFPCGTRRLGWDDAGFEFGFEGYGSEMEFWTTGEKYPVSEQKLKGLIAIASNNNL